MSVRWRHGISTLVLVAILGGFGCGEDEPAQPPEAVVSEEEQRLAAEAALRREQTAALGERTEQLTSAIEATASRWGAAEELPAALGAELAAVEQQAGEAERLLAELQQAGAEGWQATRQQLDAALGEAEAARAAAEAAVADWQRRQTEAVAARDGGRSPIDPETGLIQGLDGGDYEQYAVAAVTKVQTRLRRLGLYAGPVDGVFDLATLEAVGAFQEGSEMYISGVPSPMTRRQLFAEEG